MNPTDTTITDTAPQPQESTPDTSAIREAQGKILLIRQELSKALIGQQAVVDQILVGLLSAGHVLLEGVPGLGKTLLVKALSKILGGSDGRVQFTPDLMPGDVTGHAIFNPKTAEFTIRKGPIFCHFLLADEINRAPAKTQAALLEAMQEGQVTIEGDAMQLPQPMMVMATQNPVESEGTYPLPEAQLDRFLLKIYIDYPTLTEEVALVKMVTSGNPGQSLAVEHLHTLLSPAEVLQLQQTTAQLHVDDAVLNYAIQIIHATRETSGIALGAGPRGSIGLIRAARGQAMLAERDFVTPDDVKDIAKATLRHRIQLGAELEMEGRTPDNILDELLANIEAPRL